MHREPRQTASWRRRRRVVLEFARFIDVAVQEMAQEQANLGARHQ